MYQNCISYLYFDPSAVFGLVLFSQKGGIRNTLFESFPKCACLSTTHQRVSIIFLKVSCGGPLRPSLETYDLKIYLISSLQFLVRRIGAGWEMRFDHDLPGDTRNRGKSLLIITVRWKQPQDELKDKHFYSYLPFMIWISI